MTRQISVTFRDARNGNREHTVTQTEIDNFARFHISEGGLRDRISYLMLAEIMLMEERMGTAPAEILQSIRQLEAGDTSPGTKPASPFRHPPLRGLWHKHYFCARFLPHNMSAGLTTKRFRKITPEFLEKYEGEPVTEEILRELEERVLDEPLTERFSESRMTGEWIVFFQRAGLNYYLCLATHTSLEDDAKVFFKARAAAMHHGPDWEAWFSEAIA